MPDSIFLTIPLSEHSAANNCVFWISNRTFPFSKSASKVYSLEINQPLWTHASSESAKVWWAGLEWHRTPLPELWSSNIFATLGACVIWKYIKYIEMTGDSTSQAEDCFWTLSAWLTQPLSIDCGSGYCSIFSLYIIWRLLVNFECSTKFVLPACLWGHSRKWKFNSIAKLGSAALTSIFISQIKSTLSPWPEQYK